HPAERHETERPQESQHSPNERQNGENRNSYRTLHGPSFYRGLRGSRRLCRRVPGGTTSIPPVKRPRHPALLPAIFCHWIFTFAAILPSPWREIERPACST